MASRIRIGTRGSPLALAQSELVARALKQARPGLVCEAVVIATTGDREAARSERDLEGGKGIFVREIEEALIKGAIDVAVHSMKDLPVDLPAGLALCAVLPREDPRDAFVSREGISLADLAPGAKVATGSPRRQAQLKRRYPKLDYVPIRGNVGTRLDRIREGRADGVVVALAGLRRLGIKAAMTVIPLEECLPAPGQGAVGCEIRRDDRRLQEIVSPIDDRGSSLSVAAERAFLRGLGGGCRVPIAAMAEVRGQRVELSGLVSAPDGSRMLTGKSWGESGNAAEAGERLAAELLGKGAAGLLSP